MSTSNVLVKLLGLALIAAPLTAMAEDGAGGPNEFSGSLSYNDIEDVTLTAAQLSYGRYLTDMHEVGVTASYLKLELDEEGSLDGNTIGLFYHLNFDMDGIVTPYIGVNASYIGGDLGDAYDFGYGASVGMKIYPFDNGGFIFSVAYQQLNAAEDFFEDADGTSVSFGMLLRF